MLDLFEIFAYEKERDKMRAAFGFWKKFRRDIRTDQIKFTVVYRNERKILQNYGQYS